MLPCPLIILYLFSKTELKASTIGSYSDEELRIYREIWNSIRNNFDTQKQQLLYCILIIWTVIFILGLLLLIAIYGTELKPLTKMEAFASEIAKGNLDTPLPMNRGNLMGRFTESFDLMREELKSSKEKELKAETAKRELVAELSHDLKTPVASIQATCEVLNEILRRKTEEGSNTLTPEETASVIDKLNIISAKAETISRLTRNVFNATLDDMEEIEVRTSEITSSVIEEYFGNLKDYGNIILENHIPECLVYIDPLRMEQVADNIVGNAYKYAGGDIHVSFDEISPTEKQQDRYIRIRIKDNGPGVPEEELGLLTEKFYRGRSTLEKPGYGLGLYLVNWYMEKMGGGMEYYNDNGFVVELLVRKV